MQKILIITSVTLNQVLKLLRFNLLILSLYSTTAGVGVEFFTCT